ncbi:MAG: LamG-like jellyroll fold domain-containing protein [Thermotogota bacterium]|nr:LamG-like jellyroll fold domain-containing protein [Thermotogota bacterium]
MTSQKPDFGAEIDISNFFAQHLIGSWVLNEYNGNFVNDGSGNRLNGTLGSTTTWVGAGLSFDGTDNSNITVSDPGTGSVLDITDKISIAVKVFPTNVSIGTIINKNRTSSEYASTNYVFRFNSGYLEFYYRAAPGWCIFRSSTTFAANTWYDILVTCDFGNDPVFYMNGKSYGGSWVSGSALTPNTGNGNLYVGVVPGVAERFSGVISHVVLWRCTFASSEAIWFSTEPYSMFGRSKRILRCLYVSEGGADDLLLLRGNLRGNFHELSGGLN